jgi:hypothetical protein
MIINILDVYDNGSIEIEIHHNGERVTIERNGVIHTLPKKHNPLLTNIFAGDQINFDPVIIRKSLSRP